MFTFNHYTSYLQVETEQTKRVQTTSVVDKVSAPSADERDSRHNKKPNLEKGRDSQVDNSRFSNKVASNFRNDYPTPGGTSTSSGDLGYGTGPSEVNFPNNYSQNSTPGSNFEYHYSNYHHHPPGFHHQNPNQPPNFIGTLPQPQPALINQPNPGVWWPNADGRGVFPPNAPWPGPGALSADGLPMAIPQLGGPPRGPELAFTNSKLGSPSSAASILKKKETTSNSPVQSDASAVNTPTKDGLNDPTAEQRKTLDLDTRIAMLLKDKAGGMAPPFLQFGSDSDDEKKSCAGEEMLSNPPSPFLTEDIYVASFQKNLQRNRDRKRARQNSLNQIPKSTEIDEDLGSVISSSEDEALLGSYSPVALAVGNENSNSELAKGQSLAVPLDDDRMSLSPLSSGDEKIEEVQ